MLVDVTLQITPKMVTDAQGNEKKALAGHLGTHFDVMDKEFPLEYTRREGILFDVSKVDGRDICSDDIDLDKVQRDMFVAFYSGYIEKAGYGSKLYFTEHPQLSNELIEKLLDKQISIIGLDFAGIRRGREHTVTDQTCADRNVFIVENLCNLKKLISSDRMTIHTYPMSYRGVTGLPCRVIAELEED